MKRDSDPAFDSTQTEVVYEDPAPFGLPAQAESYACEAISSPLTNIGLVIGVLTGFGETGVPMVEFLENISGEPVPARSTVALDVSQIGCEVALAFERGEPAKPIVLGCLKAATLTEREASVGIKLDGQRFILSAEREIVLSCGKASIVLTQAGKVLISGAYVLSRSSGINRIKGAAVQIN